MNKYLFTSESVTEGHPDKMCDIISDAIVDELIAHDPKSRVACETMVKDNSVWLIGEVTSSYKADYERIARDAIREIGYTPDCGFDGDTCEVTVRIERQSADIALGVDSSLETKSGTESEQLGAGDQGMMFGYACNETEELMPMPISLAHKLTKQLTKVRKDGVLKYLRPDGKSQVTIEYRDDRPARIDAVVVSSQHTADVDIETLREDIKREVIEAVLPLDMLDEDTKFFINPTGRFVVGGPVGDSGLTGRKIIVDTYGGRSRHGGGAFSGKDPTKVDRSAAYYSRYIAKNIVAAKLADKCEVELAYAIGVANPVSVFIDTFGTESVDSKLIGAAVKKVFDMRPSSIIKELELTEMSYKKLAAYGHMGRREHNASWERVDRVDALNRVIKELQK
ncbi:MAG: methionine adenosyltransferase [Oscillospiraceae bacterium]